MKTKSTSKKQSISKKRPSKNASVAAQRAWAIMTERQRNEIRKRYRQDPDKDGVPTGYDCRPYNPKKQESFLPADMEYIKSHPVVPVRRINERAVELGSGRNGTVVKIKDNDRLVLKIGKDLAWSPLKSEANFHKKHDMEKLPLITPMKTVKTDKGKYALIKPTVKPLLEPGSEVKNKSKFTDARLAALKKKIIELSYKGFIFDDGLQLGLDKANRLLQFDIGDMVYMKPRKNSINNIPFRENNKHWKNMLEALGKSPEKYGLIVRSEVLDKKYIQKPAPRVKKPVTKRPIKK